ncbi:MAG TPA: M23 family metallopeptidase [Segeticoccus sp.]|nr:M23 family metallopeptidase [Segeticoccus sp.]
MLRPRYAGRHRGTAPSRRHAPAGARVWALGLPAAAAGVLLVVGTGASVQPGTTSAAAEPAGATSATQDLTRAGVLGAIAAPPADDGPLQDRARARASRGQQLRTMRAERHRAERRDRRERARAHRWVRPTSGRVTSGFGERWGRLHAGLDIAVPAGTPLHAMSSGTVTTAGWEPGGGFVVAVRQWDGTVIEFLHLSRGTVSVGDHVRPGQLVGYSGSTGHSTGPHLHLEVHPHGGDPIDPAPWLAEHDVRC